MSRARAGNTESSAHLVMAEETLSLLHLTVNIVLESSRCEDVLTCRYSNASCFSRYGAAALST